MEEIIKLNRRIQELGLTNYQIHKGTGISQSTLGRILGGKTKNPNNTTIEAIWRFLSEDNVKEVEELKPEKVRSIRKNLGLTQTELSEKLNVTLRTVQHWEKGSYKVPTNVGTLLGNMVAEASPLDYTEMTVMYVPLVSKYAYAGYLGGYGDDEYVGDLPKIPFANGFRPKGKYLCFEVRGDSMTNGTRESIEEGDIVLAREVGQHHWVNKLHINQWDFVIVHKEEGILVKRIIDHDTLTGDLTLHSLNDYYEDFKVNLKDVLQILNIVEITRKPRR